MAKNVDKLKDVTARLHETYRDQMDALEKSPLRKARGGKLDQMDYYALGKQLEQFENTMKVIRESSGGSVNSLGKLPNIAFDVITAVQGVSVLPLITSTQPIEEQQGIIYFKNIKAVTTKGNMTANQNLVDPRTGVKTPQKYAGNFLEQEEIATANGTDTAFTATLARTPIVTQTVKVSLSSDPAVMAMDVGASSTDPNLGRIWGNGISGTVNYTTGAIVLNFNTAPANGASVHVSYQENYEQAAELPRIRTYFDSKTVQAEVFTLAGTMGVLESYGMQKRFGMLHENELTKDLVVEINKEIGGHAIRSLYVNATGATTTWYKKPQSGVSYADHKLSFKDALSTVESVLVGNTQRGTVSTIIAGLKVCEVIATLPGFRKLADGNNLGAHVFGTLDNVTVIRCPEASIMPTNEAICIWNGVGGFESAAVYSPFMPLITTEAIPSYNNPLSSQKAAAVWSAFDVVVPGFIAKLKVEDAQEPI